MAEVRTTPGNASTSSRRFLQFLMMQAQNALYLLGQIPSPDGQALPPNLDAAKMLIDQLEMIKEKTQGNLTPDEQSALENTLVNLQLTFVEVSGGVSPGMMPERSSAALDEWAAAAGAEDAPNLEHPVPATSTPTASTKSEPLPKSDDDDNDDDKPRRFVKSYG